MKHNMGSTDRWLRALIIAPIAVVAAMLVGAGTFVGALLLIVAGIMLGTAASGFCPLYRLFGLSTARRAR